MSLKTPLIKSKDQAGDNLDEQSQASSGDLCIVKPTQTIEGLTQVVESYTIDEDLTHEFEIFTGYVRAHLFTSGDDDKSLLVAKTRFVQWMIVCKIPMTSLNVQICQRILLDLFNMPEVQVDMIPFQYNAPVNVRTTARIGGYKIMIHVIIILGLVIVAIVFRRNRYIILTTLLLMIASGYSPIKEYLRAQKYWRQQAMALSPIKLELPQTVADHCTERLCVGKFPAGRIKVKKVVCTPRFTRTGFSIAFDYWYIPRSCTHNETVAVRERLLCDPISTVDDRNSFWGDTKVLFKRLNPLPKYSIQMMPEVLADWFRRYPGSRARYLEATQAGLNSYPMVEITSNTVGFPKREAMFSKLEKMHPRWISGKHDHYLLSTGPMYWNYLKIAKTQCFTRFEDILQHGFLYASGFEPSLLGKFVTWFEDQAWFVLEFDISRNDGHSETEALEFEYSVYEDLRFSPELLKYLKMDIGLNKGRSNNGVSYTTIGKMPSGKCNTSFGNSLRVFAMVCHYMWSVHRLLPGRDFVVLVLGDDALVFTRKQLSYEDITRFFAKAGHKLEPKVFDNQSYDLISFCSGYFWRGAHHRVLGPKPFRILAKSFMPTSTTIVKDIDLRCWMRDVAVGMASYCDLPVLGLFLKKMYKNFAYLPESPTKIKRLTKKSEYSIWGAEFKCELDVDGCYEQFANIYRADAVIYEALIKKVDDYLHVNYSHPLFDYALMVDGVLTNKSVNLFRANPIVARHVRPVETYGFFRSWFTRRYFGIW